MGACAARVDTPVNHRARIVKDFSDRVQSYIALHKKLAAQLPHLPSKADAAQVTAHRDALAAAIREARAGAKHGDIFDEEMEGEVRRIIRPEVQGPRGNEIVAALRQGNPRVDKGKGEAQPVIKVNASYPQSAPLSTVPPSILINLPKIPEELEYRFVGRHLILRDVAANLIVDYVWEATPRL